ncbi:MAG: hypothetical protein AAF497_05750, partial [Planctomycetota bacterium]
MTRIVFVCHLLLVSSCLPLAAQEPDPQPFRAQVQRVQQALESTGQPLTEEVAKQLREASSSENAVAELQKVLDPLCLVHIDINAESRVKVKAGEAERSLIQNGWTAFLVKVTNVAGVTA